MYKTSLWEMWTIFVWIRTVTSKHFERCNKGSRNTGREELIEQWRKY